MSESKKYFFNIPMILWILFYLPIYSQVKTNQTDKLAEEMQSLTKNNNSDLVYLQTNKHIYETEEDVWFKGYVLDAQYFIPSGRNKTLFLQLTEDKTEQVFWNKKYEIENGFVDGHLFLENTLPEGTYTLAGYTSNSFTKEKEFYAFKKITIVKAINQKNNESPVEKDSIIHFSTFPEGGKLISEIKNNLAFKAVNSKGLPVDVSGTLFENNVPLVNFKTNYAGMGVLNFTPYSFKKYHIKLDTPLGEIFPMPSIDTNGKALCLLKNTKEGLVFRVSQNGALKEETVYLRLQMRGIVYTIAMGKLKKELIVKIPLNDIPQGIAEVTLFNENLLPVAERLLYVNLEQKINISAEIDKSVYKTRDQVSLKLKVTDQNNVPVVAHLGLSVYDGLYQNKENGTNIQTHFLLSTQLKGAIYNPAYYFNEQNKDREKELDLLMLTQGWRSYVWHESNIRERSNSIGPIIFDELKGKIELIKPTKKSILLTKQKAIMIFSGDEKEKEMIMSDSTGVFVITPSHLKKGEGGYTYIKLLTPAEPKYRIAIRDLSLEAINKNRKIKTNISPLDQIKKIKTNEVSPFSGRETLNKLNEVLITSKKTGFSFRDKYIGKLDSLARIQHFTNDWVCVDHTGRNTKQFGYINCPQLDCHGGATKKPVEGEKYYQFTGYKKLSNSPCGPFSIDGPTIEVVYHYPDLTEAELLQMFDIAMIEGYYGKKVFYEPIYDDVTKTDSTPDYRNTLFWKPDIITNQQGEANITFFCSDINSLFTGNIEGVNGDGLLGSGNFQFSVRK